MRKTSDELKKHIRRGFYAGVGLGVTVGEMIDNTMDTLVERGERTVPFSKVDNKELKHNKKADKK